MAFQSFGCCHPLFCMSVEKTNKMLIIPSIYTSISTRTDTAYAILCVQHKELHNLIDGFQIQRWSRVCQGTWAHKVSETSRVPPGTTSDKTGISYAECELWFNRNFKHSHEIHDKLRKCERASFAAIRTLWVKPGANSVVVDDIIVENYKYFISYVHTQKFPNRRPLLALVNLGDITTTIERQFRCRLAGLQCWNQLAANWIHLLACQSKQNIQNEFNST